jgi:hypothetical protein
MEKEFPRKEIYVYTSKNPLGEGKVSAVENSKIILPNSFKEYSERKWELENKGWISSVIPSAIEVEAGEDYMTIHCGITEYKYLLGMVKMVAEKKSTNSVPSIQGLSTEIMPLTTDGIFPLRRREKSTTQHGVGFYDIPNAGQNAQMWLSKIPYEYSKLVTDIFDMIGFPKWNLIRNIGLNKKEIGGIFFTGFSRGFEVSLDSQFNGYTEVTLSANELRNRNGNENTLFFRFRDLMDVLSSINNDGKVKKIKEDVSGNVPKPTENGFKLIDDCIGTLLSNLKHLNGKQEYTEALDILKDKGYLIKEVTNGMINLNSLG